MTPKPRTIAILLLGLSLLASSCGDGDRTAPTQTPTVTNTATESPTPAPSRQSAIPADAVKMTPTSDSLSPILHSSEWDPPIPVPGPINTAGAEDSPFVTPDGHELYFFFTPDVRVPPEKQLIDGVTGIYRAELVDGEWGKPQRVLLNDPGELSLDGCQFVQGDTIWFCSVRAGNSREIDIYTATRVDGQWANWTNAGEQLNADCEVGELHLSADGDDLFYHSSRAGGAGGMDIWVTSRTGTAWSEPVNVAAVNTATDEGWPFLSQDGSELWFLRWHQGSPAIFRARLADGVWQAPELIVSQFAGEPSLDRDGNLYFVHHYFIDGQMVEADIYIARKR